MCNSVKNSVFITSCILNPYIIGRNCQSSVFSASLQMTLNSKQVYITKLMQIRKTQFSRGSQHLLFSRACTAISQSYSLVNSRVRVTQILRWKSRKPKVKRGKRKVIETNAKGLLTVQSLANQRTN